jgi:hypothetical protein
MSSTIKSYLYDNKILVQVLDDDPTIKTRYRVVYSKTLKVYKDIDNQITVEFKNNDQKAANLTSRTFTLNVTDPGSNVAIWSSGITVANATLAIGTVTLDTANVANLTLQRYNYTISYTYGNLTLPTYTDDNWGASGQMEVISNVY